MLQDADQPHPLLGPSLPPILSLSSRAARSVAKLYAHTGSETVGPAVTRQKPWIRSEGRAEERRTDCAHGRRRKSKAEGESSLITIPLRRHCSPQARARGFTRNIAFGRLTSTWIMDAMTNVSFFLRFFPRVSTMEAILLSQISEYHRDLP